MPSKLSYLLFCLILLMSVCIATNATARNATIPVRNADEQPFALIAGGSKGIGYAIAEALAKRQWNLILIARHEDGLKEAKRKLESNYKVRIEYLAMDLSREESAGELAAWCVQHHIKLKMLCNVAGFGGANDYLDLPLDSIRYMIRLNVESAMSLSLTLLDLLKENSPSYILNVSSMAAFAPMPVKNTYSGTKSALLFFSYSLHYQLKYEDISVSCLCPGPVFTKPSIRQDTKEKLGWFGMQMAVPVQRVGEVAVRKTLKGRMLIIPGTLSKISSVFIRLLPRRWVAGVYAKIGG